MPDVAHRVRQRASSGADAFLAAGLAAGFLAYEAVAGRSAGADWTTPILVALSCGGIAGRRRWPFWSAVACSAGLLLTGLSGNANALNGPVDLLLLSAAVLLAYPLGTECRLGVGLTGVVLLAASLQVGNGSFNPLGEMLTFGPWLAGRVVLSRRRLAAQLEERNRELEAGRALFAQESVRYERARIARELHDIVAHCLSLVVVQAGAGQRLATTNVASAVEALDSIAEAAEEAQTEIGRLVDMLNGTDGAHHAPGLQMIDELVQRANATGVAVRYRPAGDCSRLPRPASEAAYRVVQESLTNAIKHAPGAPVDITVRETGGWIEVEVITAVARAGPSGLEQSGGGRGLVGMSERVGACGGTFAAGPTAEGGWHVSALLPGN